MTELLYMWNCYLRECESRVVESGEGWVVLDRTVFYPTGGGQEHDTGKIIFGGKEVGVVDVRKDKGEVKHILAEKISIPKDTKIKCVVDWTRRHANMRMHTSQHLISAVALELFGVSTKGNQIHPERSRIDFYPARFTRDDLKRIEERANALIAQELPVKIYELPRNEALARTPAHRTETELIPKNIQSLRMVEIEGYDVCPCGGTHVANIKEIGRIRITNVDNKGRDLQRITYVLEARVL